jgi:outer membrane protein assembly factor BamB
VHTLRAIDGSESWTLAVTAAGFAMPSGGGVLTVLGQNLACLDAEKGGWRWDSFSIPIGPPVLASNLIVAGLSGDRLGCISDADGTLLWTAAPESSLAGPPSMAGDRILVPRGGTGKSKGFLESRSIVDGSLVWRAELDEKPISYVVANETWVCVATDDDKIAVFKAADGKAREPILVGGKPVAPALWKDTLVIAGEARIAAYDLSTSEWLWNYKDQDNIGTATGPPVVCGEVIWVGTTKKGLLAIGVPETKGK